MNLYLLCILFLFWIKNWDFSSPNIPYSPVISSSAHLSGGVFLPQLDQHQLVDALTDHDVDVEEEEEDVEQDDDTSEDIQVNECDELYKMSSLNISNRTVYRTTQL